MASNMATDEACQVLIINVDDENPGFWGEMYPDLEKSITEKYKTKIVTTSPAAIDVLTTTTSNADDGIPRVVLVVASGIFRPGHASTHFRLHQMLSTHAKDNGAVVVFCGTVPSFIRMDEISVIFSKAYDLPWDRASYTRGNFKRNDSMRSAFGDALFETLPRRYSSKALMFGGMRKDSKLYTYEGECGIAFHKYGKGRIAYIGDVNNEPGSVAAVKAMIEVGINSSEFTSKTLSIPTPTAACNVCLRPSHPEHNCPKCEGVVHYCSKACQVYDWLDHKSSCAPPAWKDPSTNLFVRLFPKLATDPDNNNDEDAVVRLIDAYRNWHEANSSIELHDFMGDLNEEIYVEFSQFLAKARAANAVPIWWDEDMVEVAMDYATSRHLMGKLKSTVYIGERIRDPEHIQKQYGGNQAEWANVVELGINIGRAQLPSGEYKDRF